MLETRQLCKEFPSRGWPWATRRRNATSSGDGGRDHPVRALLDVNLQVAAGEIYALLGPNGAGKSTLLRILSTLLLPSAGWARVAGYDVVKEEAQVRSRIGLVVGDERSFYWRLSGRHNLEFFGALQGLRSRDLRARIDRLGELLELTDLLDRPFRTYSTGMRQRLALARGLLHDPPFLFMDEPSRSLDPTATGAFHQLLRRLVWGEGKTILLVTHQLSEARAVCDRAGVLDSGRLVLETADVGELEDYFRGREQQDDGAERLARLAELEAVVA